MMDTSYTELSWKNLQNRMSAHTLPVAVIAPWGKRRLELLEALTGPLAQQGEAFWWGAQQVQLPLSQQDSQQDLQIQHFNTQPTLGGGPQDSPAVQPADLSAPLLAAWLATQITGEPKQWPQQQKRVQKILAQQTPRPDSWGELLEAISSRFPIDPGNLQIPSGLNRQQTPPSTPTSSVGQMTIISGHRDDLTSWREEGLLMLLAFLGQKPPQQPNAHDSTRVVVLEDWLESVWPRHRWVLAQALQKYLQQNQHYCLIATENPLNWRTYKEENKFWQNVLPVVGAEYQGGWPDFWKPGPGDTQQPSSPSDDPMIWVGAGTTRAGAQYFKLPRPGTP